MKKKIAANTMQTAKSIPCSGWGTGAVFLGATVLALLLAGCGAIPLSQRGMVRGVFLAWQADHIEVCLLTMDPEAPEGEEAYKHTTGQGVTPAQALARAEQAMETRADYSLCDTAVLPADCSWQTLQSMGEQLVEQVQPAPEMTLWAMQYEDAIDWRQAAEWYKQMKHKKEETSLQCGLPQLTAQANFCALPLYREEDYGVVFYAPQRQTTRWEQPLPAQLTAVLCGMTDTLEADFAENTAKVQAKTDVTMQANALQLHLKDAKLRDLTQTATRETALPHLLEQEVQQAWLEFSPWNEASQDAFHTGFWLACRYGPGYNAPQPMPLQLLWE